MPAFRFNQCGKARLHRFRADGGRDGLVRRYIYNVDDQGPGWKVDFTVTKNGAFSRDEFSRRMECSLLDVRVFIASPEDTIVAKLEWSKQSGGSERQRRDVAGIVATMGHELNVAYVERWVAELDLAAEWHAAQGTSI